jgi:hypothetical protein
MVARCGAAWIIQEDPSQSIGASDASELTSPYRIAQRLELLDGIPLLTADPGIERIANEMMARAILPPKALFDALHIAMTAYHRVDYLLTWNCRHIANARILPRIHRVLNDLGVPIPIICTPEEMVEDDPKS